MGMSPLENVQQESPVYRRTFDVALVGFIVAVAGVLGLSAGGVL